MGCCCGKPAGAADPAFQPVPLPSKEQAGTGVAAAGTVATGALIGAAVAGPAAPLGAIIGAAVGAAVARSTAGTVGKAVVAPVGLLEDLWRGLVNRKEIIELLPDIGVLRSERPFYPPAMSELTETNSYLYQIQPAIVSGLKFADTLEGKPLSAEQRASLAAAVKELESRKVLAITGDASSMLHYQEEVTKMTKLPVLLSALLQAPLLAAVYSKAEKILVITSDATVTTPAKLAQLLLKCGVTQEDVPRFVLVGLETIDGFKASQLASGDVQINPNETAKQLLKIVKERISTSGRGEGGLRAVLFESTMLPMFSDLIRKECQIPVFDSVSLADLVHKAHTDNPRFGISFGPKTSKTEAPTLRLEKDQMPAIGIMRIDYTYPAAMGDAAHPNSYYYRTPHATVKGLTFEYVQTGDPLTEAQAAEMARAVKELETVPGLMGIAGDCGFLVNYQAYAVTLSTKAPVFISAMLQCTLLTSLFGDDSKVLVLTANGPELRRVMPKLLSLVNVPPKDHDRFIVEGCENLPGFEAVKLAQKVDVEKVQPHCVALVQSQLKANPAIRAVLLECTELPPYADAIREATGLVVMDVITLVDYFHGAVSENPYFGIDWNKLASTPVQQGSSTA